MRGIKEPEERKKQAEGEKAGVVCRLEIIGVHISGQSVIFIFDAVVQLIVYTGFVYRNQFHLIRAGGRTNELYHYKRTH